MAPKIGDFSKGRGEAYQTRLAAAQKSQNDEGSIESKPTEAIRKYEYQQRRKQWKRRLAHLKALCIVIIVAYGQRSWFVGPRFIQLTGRPFPPDSQPKDGPCRSGSANLEDAQRRARPPVSSALGQRSSRTVCSTMGYPDRRQEKALRCRCGQRGEYRHERLSPACYADLRRLRATLA